MNNYRVDINCNNYVPCGMNTIAYIGDSLTLAKRHFIALQLNKEKTHLGAPITKGILSKWCDNKKDFIILDQFNMRTAKC